MNIFTMKCFVRIAETLNLTKAALEMSISQPALSNQLKRLEREMDVELLKRSSHDMSLTPAGQVMYQGICRMLEDYERMIRELEKLKGVKTLFRIGYDGPDNWANIQSLLNTFLQDHFDVELEIISERENCLTQMLQNGRIDCIFVEESQVDQIEELDYRVLFTDSGCFAVPDKHKLATKRSVCQDDLANEKIYYNRDNSAAINKIRDMLLASGITEKQLHYASGYQSTIAMAKAYWGMAAIPVSFNSAENGTVYIPYNSPAIRINFVVAWRKQNSSKILEDFLKKCLLFSWPV